MKPISNKSSRVAASTMRGTQGQKSSNNRMMSPFSSNVHDGNLSPESSMRMQGRPSKESAILALIGNMS